MYTVIFTFSDTTTKAFTNVINISMSNDVWSITSRKGTNDNISSDTEIFYTNKEVVSSISITHN